MNKRTAGQIRQRFQSKITAVFVGLCHLIKKKLWVTIIVRIFRPVMEDMNTRLAFLANPDDLIESYSNSGSAEGAPADQGAGAAPAPEADSGAATQSDADDLLASLGL